eukprot:14330218-Alexandrium_andersonii.AAC.1
MLQGFGFGSGLAAGAMLDDDAVEVGAACGVAGIAETVGAEGVASVGVAGGGGSGAASLGSPSSSDFRALRFCPGWNPFFSGT